MLNTITLQGRLTADPELRATPNKTSVVTFTIACDNDYGEKHTDFITCVAWRQTAEFISKYFKKGQVIFVTGRLRSRAWEDRDGKKRTEWEVQIDRAYFGDSKSQSSSGTKSQEPGFDDVQDASGDLPF